MTDSSGPFPTSCNLVHTSIQKDEQAQLQPQSKEVGVDVTCAVFAQQKFSILPLLFSPHLQFRVASKKFSVNCSDFLTERAPLHLTAQFYRHKAKLK